MNLLDSIFVNLRIISKIPQGGRISTTSPNQVKLERGDVSTKVWRTLSGDNRNKTMTYLMGLINDIIEISDNIINSLFISKNYDANSQTFTPKIQASSPPSISILQMNENSKKLYQLRKLVRELHNAKGGILNLHSTYRSDANILSSLEEIGDKIDIQIKKINHALVYIGEDNEKNNSLSPSYKRDRDRGSVSVSVNTNRRTDTSEQSAEGLYIDSEE